MFLWAKLMLEYIATAPNFDEILKLLADLPSGLEKAYTLLLGRLVARLDKHQLQVARMLFLFTCASGRALKMEKLRYAYALMKKPKSEAASSGLDRFLL